MLLLDVQDDPVWQQRVRPVRTVAERALPIAPASGRALGTAQVVARPGVLKFQVGPVPGEPSAQCGELPVVVVVDVVVREAGTDHAVGTMAGQPQCAGPQNIDVEAAERGARGFLGPIVARQRKVTGRDQALIEQRELTAPAQKALERAAL